jgi:di/tricarboxylate transporter
LLGIAIVALALTQMLHGAAVAVIMAPVALDAAQLLAINPHAMAAAVIVGASATYLLPVGHPAPLLVQQPGGYRPKDYIIYGAGLVVVTIAITAILLPLIWPFG